MPIVVSFSPTTPPPTTPPPPVGVPTRRVIEPPGVYRALWYPPDGGAPMDLNPPDEDWWSLKANAGLGAVPVDLVTTPNPDGGVIVESTRPKERTILWPMRMRSTTHLGLLKAWRHVQHQITQTRDYGPARLRLQRPDGTEREILCHYSSGLEGDPDDGTWLEVTAVINLLCPDPFWRDTRGVTMEFADEPEPDYLAPYPSIGSGQTLGTVDVPNIGHRAAWPEWTIRGPLTSLTASNDTRGQSFTLTYALAAGEVATISSRPIQVRGPGGANLVGALGLAGGGGKPWRLDGRRTSKVTFAAVGSAPDSAPGADDGTRIWLSYPIDYESA
ncbi:hypothetical protein AB0A95_30675 [Micromonospora sp. NPDC049230]|uniref:hypothetical protein n=1 Tax=Micromonospora sp. NPDC049230 TaxID=3155502 RepID=UPI0033CAE312